MELTDVGTFAVHRVPNGWKIIAPSSDYRLPAYWCVAVVEEEHLGTAGMKGLGQRHRQFGTHDLTVIEKQQRVLDETRRQLARTEAQRDALAGALAVAARVLHPYAQTQVATHKPRPISPSALRPTKK